MTDEDYSHIDEFAMDANDWESSFGLETDTNTLDTYSTYSAYDYLHDDADDDGHLYETGIKKEEIARQNLWGAADSKKERESNITEFQTNTQGNSTFFQEQTRVETKALKKVAICSKPNTISDENDNLSEQMRVSPCRPKQKVSFDKGELSGTFSRSKFAVQQCKIPPDKNRQRKKHLDNSSSDKRTKSSGKFN